MLQLTQVGERKRIAVAAAAAVLGVLVCAAPAHASRVLVLDHGKVRAHDDSAIPAQASVAPVAPGPTSPCSACSARRLSRLSAAASARRSDPVRAAIRRALAAGQIEPAEASRYRKTYSRALSLRNRLGLTGRRELGYVVDTLRRLAGAGRLSAGRMPAMFLLLQRNREWWGSKGAPGSGARVRFGKTRLIFQYYPGHGLQIQPLANFGTANGYWYSKKDTSLRALVDELLAIRVARGSFTTWEYYFHFGGGAPPWMSGMAQATAVQALTRAGTRLGDASLLSVAREGLGAFEQRTPVGARVPAGSGAWYALYSFSPGLEVLNGMLQSLIGLQTYATLTGDPRGAALFEQGDRIARARIGAYDTGAWSLYSRSGARPGAEANLNYHTLNRDFARRLCRLTSADAYCTAADNFSRYLREDPQLTPFGPKPAPARAGRGVRFHFNLSKVGRAGITVSAGGRTYLSTSAGFSRGSRYFRWVPPRLKSERSYDYRLFARDLAGNTRSESGTLRVKPVAPRR